MLAAHEGHIHFNEKETVVFLTTFLLETAYRPRPLFQQWPLKK